MSLARRVYRERRGIVLPLLLLTAASVGMLALGVFPLSRHVAGLESDAVDANLALKLARADELKARHEQTAKARAEGDLQKFYVEVLPRDFIAATQLTNQHLDQWARENKIAFSSGQFRPAKLDEKSKTRLTKMTGKVTLKGRYEGILNFLYQVETAEEFIVIEEVNLNQPGSNDTGTSLELDLVVSTYFLVGGPALERP
jgi:Tfp pilus assembly protein PilO